MGGHSSKMFHTFVSTRISKKVEATKDLLGRAMTYKVYISHLAKLKAHNIYRVQMYSKYSNMYLILLH